MWWVVQTIATEAEFWLTDFKLGTGMVGGSNDCY